MWLSMIINCVVACSITSLGLALFDYRIRQRDRTIRSLRDELDRRGKYSDSLQDQITLEQRVSVGLAEDRQALRDTVINHVREIAAGDRKLEDAVSRGQRGAHLFIRARKDAKHWHERLQLQVQANQTFLRTISELQADLALIRGQLKGVQDHAEEIRSVNSSLIQSSMAAKHECDELAKDIASLNSLLTTGDKTVPVRPTEKV